MVELRYTKSGMAYFPEVRTKEGWCFIDKNNMKGSYIENLAKALANLSPSTQSKTLRYCPKYYFKKHEVTRQTKFANKIYFMEEYLVLAFLGALKQYYTEEVKEFNI